MSRVVNKIKHEWLRLKVKTSKWKRGICESNRNPKMIVSLTSYPKRFSKIDLCIKSLCNQGMKPDKIILWLGNDTPEEDVEKLKMLYSPYGVTIERDDSKNLYSHKKYYYAMQKYPEDIIITADDDLIYPPDWIESLYKTYEQYPECICARRNHRIKWDKEGNVLPYLLWEGESKHKKPSHSLLPTTGAGALFPPKCMVKECFNEKIFMTHARTADDIWLKIMAVISDRQIVWVPNDLPMPTTVDTHQDEMLTQINCEQQGNDVIFKDLCEYYHLTQENFE